MHWLAEKVARREKGDGWPEVTISASQVRLALACGERQLDVAGNRKQQSAIDRDENTTVCVLRLSESDGIHGARSAA
jgi:hypothetical protein